MFYFFHRNQKENEAETFSHRKKRKKSNRQRGRKIFFLGVFFVTGKTFVHLEDGALDEVTAEEAVLVEEVGNGLAEGVLANFARLAVTESQHQFVHVVESGSFKVINGALQ